MREREVANVMRIVENTHGLHHCILKKGRKRNLEETLLDHRNMVIFLAVTRLLMSSIKREFFIFLAPTEYH